MHDVWTWLKVSALKD